MDERSKQKLEKVHPHLRDTVATIITQAAASGLDVRVTDGLRTADEQNRLYAKGRTAPGEIVTYARANQSNHNFGLATDLCTFVDGKPDYNNMHNFVYVAKLAKSLGLEAGIDWKKSDAPHIQIKGMSLKACQNLFHEGGLPMVWKKADSVIKGNPIAMTYTPSFDDLLEFGDKGQAVKELQTSLSNLKYMRQYEIDGDFGKVTKNAVIGFQRQHDLSADGIVGDETRAAISEEIQKLVKKMVGTEDAAREIVDKLSTAELPSISSLPLTETTEVIIKFGENSGVEDLTQDDIMRKARLEAQKAMIDVEIRTDDGVTIKEAVQTARDKAEGYKPATEYPAVFTGDANAALTKLGKAIDDASAKAKEMQEMSERPIVPNKKIDVPVPPEPQEFPAHIPTGERDKQLGFKAVAVSTITGFFSWLFNLPYYWQMIIGGVIVAIIIWLLLTYYRQQGYINKFYQEAMRLRADRDSNNPVPLLGITPAQAQESTAQASETFGQGVGRLENSEQLQGVSTYGIRYDRDSTPKIKFVGGALDGMTSDDFSDEVMEDFRPTQEAVEEHIASLFVRDDAGNKTPIGRPKAPERPNPEDDPSGKE